MLYIPLFQADRFDVKLYIFTINIKSCFRMFRFIPISWSTLFQATDGMPILQWEKERGLNVKSKARLVSYETLLYI